MKRYKTLKYSSIQFPFIEEIRKLYGIIDLSEIHEHLDKAYNDTFKISADSCTNLHDLFYNKHREGWPEFDSIYERFIRDIIAFHYDEDFLYQSFPTFRLHIPNNVAVGAFHADGDFGHPDGEVNYIVPFTNSDGTASVWVESESKKEDFAPMKMRAGELIRFNGNKLTHGNQINDTGRTRVSMDFRVLPLSKYKESDTLESKTTKQKYKEGEYYKIFSW